MNYQQQQYDDDLVRAMDEPAAAAADFLLAEFIPDDENEEL